jgi:uncharacterized protein YggU (UPF0235/DUF167 family)
LVKEGCLRVVIWVKPGASGTSVVGSMDGSLVVRVAAKAVEGQATEAALSAVAEVFGVRRRAVSLVSGATSRTKVLDVEGATQARLVDLLSTSDG